MAKIITPRWVNQPQFPLEIDWSNPITRGIRNCIVNGIPIDLVRKNAPFQYNGSYGKGSARWGRSRKYNGSASVSDGYDASWVSNNMRPSIGVVYEIETSGATQRLAALGFQGGTGGMVVSIGATGTIIRNIGSDGTGAAIFADGPTVNLNQVYSTVGTYDGANLWLYHETNAPVSTAMATGIRIVSTPRYFRFGGDDNQSASWLNGQVYLGVAWDRPLSKEEAYSFNTNPYQIFRQQSVSRTVFFAKAAVIEDIYTQTDGLAPQAWSWIPPTNDQLGIQQGAFPNIAAGTEELRTFKLEENAERAIVSWQHWNTFIPPNASYSLPEESGGTVYDDDVTEALTLSDVVDAAVEFAVSVTENLALTDSISNTAVLGSSLTEGLSLTDVVTAVGQYAASITESLTLTDSVDGASGGSTYNDSITESLSQTDTVSAIVTYAASVVESLNQTDSVSATFVTAASIVESLSQTDSISSDTTSQIIEALSLTDSYTGNVNTSADFVESLSLLDIVTAAIAYAVVVEESLNLTDSVSATGTMNISVTENLNLSDTTNASVTPAGGSTQRVYIG